ncbi:putative ribonuclease H-like domain-containing protein [Tanacetum coccineum]
MSGKQCSLFEIIKNFDEVFSVTFGGGANGEILSLPTTILGKAVSTAAMTKRVVAGTSSNVSAGIQEVSESSTPFKQDQDCILMPIWKEQQIQLKILHSKSLLDSTRIQDQDVPHDDCSFQDDGFDEHQVNTGSGEISTATPEVNTATSEGLMGPIPTTEDTQEEDQGIDLGNLSPSYAVSSTPHTRIHKDHPIDHVIGDVQSSVQTRRMTTSYSELGFLSAIYEGKTHQDLHTCLFACFLSQEEPKRVSKALSDPAWVEAMQEELLQFNFESTLLDFITAQTRAWYDTLATYLLSNGFQRGKIDQTLFIKSQKGHILLVKSYVDDIIFGSTKKELCDEFEKLMKDKFQMSSMGELTFFLGLQVQQKKKGIFISQDKYVHEILKKFNYTDVNVQDWIPLDVISTSRPNNQVCSFVHVQGFRVRISIGVSAYHTDSDYAGLHLIGSQPTVEVVQFLGNSLISWRMQETNWGLPPQQLNLEYGGCCKLPWTRS